MANLRYWTTAEINKLKAEYKGRPLVEIAADLGRTAAAVEAMKKRLDIRRHKPWSEYEMHVIRNVYPVNGIGPVRLLIPDRTEEAIRNKMFKCGIKRVTL